ncbi:MAG TPA: phosphate ABC transporter substrate-binding protein [Solirubrobacteraceae bacterium]|nr:phosphate ABC transporter substrate-binding protein [Solirubrobacteraceae bacterium]
MRAHRTLVVTLILLLALAVPTAAGAARALIIGGSTSVLPLMQKLAAAYHHQYPRIPEPKVSGGQSDIGVAGAASGRFDIGDSSRDPLSTDPKGLAFTKIARDGICVITNGKNPVANFSQQTIQSIFSGAVRNWSEVPGASASGPIDLFDRDGASGTQDAFQNIFMGEDLRISPSASQEASNGLEQSAVSADANAIGFVSFAYTSGVHAAEYQGVACNLRNARSGQYGGVRNFWMVTKGVPKGDAAKFIDWVTSGNSTTKKIIGSSWIAIH